jgi:hypothetical protein
VPEPAAVEETLSPAAVEDTLSPAAVEDTLSPLRREACTRHMQAQKHSTQYTAHSTIQLSVVLCCVSL